MKNATRTLYYIAASEVRAGDRILFNSSDLRTARKVLSASIHPNDDNFVTVWVWGDSLFGRRIKCFEHFLRSDIVKVLR